jgi:DNA-binding LacI/PurR family transcriptional regulator
VIDGVDSVAIDGAPGMRAMVEHIAGLGHQRIDYLDGSAASWSGAPKLAGARAAPRPPASTLRCTVATTAPTPAGVAAEAVPTPLSWPTTTSSPGV